MRDKSSESERRQIIPISSTNMACHTIKCKPISSFINDSIQAFQSPVMDTYMQAVRFCLVVRFDKAISGQCLHRVLKRKFIAGQVGKPWWLVLPVTALQKFVPNVLMVEIRQ